MQPGRRILQQALVGNRNQLSGFKCFQEFRELRAHDLDDTSAITADGTVGPIGGIQQKMWGALRADADYFLAPAANCPEVVDEIPGDLQLFSVATLDDALSVLDAISSDGDLSQLPTCQ